MFFRVTFFTENYNIVKIILPRITSSLVLYMVNL